MTLAVEAIGLTKDFEKGRRTIWQRLRREADQREDFIFVALSGAAFPIVVLPEYVRWVSYLLPTTHALDLVRVSALGTRPLLPAALEWAMLGLTSVGLLFLGRRAWLATEHRMRVLGTLRQH